MLKLDTEGRDIDQEVHAEHHEEERPEVVEHLGEKIPPHAYVRGEIWEGEPCSPSLCNPVQISGDQC